MTITTKDEFFNLPVMEDSPTSDVFFLGQVHFCTDQARTDQECSFLAIEERRGGRPECPRHLRQSMSWANLYSVDDKVYHYHY